MFSSSAPKCFVAYSRELPSSRRFGRAFLNSLPSFTELKDNQICGPTVAMFTPDIYNLFRAVKSSDFDWYYGDKAYFGREKYFRVTKNAYQISATGESNGRRFKRLGLTIKSWRKSGKFILLCPQSDIFMRLHGTTLDRWLAQTTADIRKFTDRPILVRHKTQKKTEENFEKSLENVFAVVVYTSIAGVQATMHGIPCFTTEVCSATDFGKLGLEDIESPGYPEDRREKYSVLADNQWTLDEIRAGRAWRDLHSKSPSIP